jgi:cation:H+ antiporter
LELGLSERVVGLTIAAIGTSAPELAASIVASIRGHHAMAVGNILGSNIFNVFFVLGGVGAIRPIDGTLATFGFDTGVMVGFSLLAALLLREKRLIRRWEGVLLVICYAAYLGFLALG